jgi:hypothetical protein
MAMESIVARCAGIDVHQAQLRASARVADKQGKRRVEEFATFGTTTPDLLELADWLASRGVTQVAVRRKAPATRPGCVGCWSTAVAQELPSTTLKNRSTSSASESARCRRCSAGD